MFSLWIVVTVEARLYGYRRLGMLTREQLCQRNERVLNKYGSGSEVIKRAWIQQLERVD